jgi:pimeloyl-ACP methyl ester carboxylesterase
MQARLSNAKLVVFAGYGHGINVLAPERCAAETRAFLAGAATR